MSAPHQHTPGPWSLRQDDSNEHEYDHAHVVSQTGDPIAMVAYDDNGDADARLVAAAPELLEALQYLIQDKPGTASFDKWWEARVAGARAAIAKATGGDK